MLIIFDVIYQIIQNIIVFRNDQEFFQPITTNQKTGKTPFIITGGRNQPAESFDLFSFRIDRFVPSHFEFG